MRKLSLFAAAFAMATGAFWTTILTDPPMSEASVHPAHRSPDQVASPTMRVRFVPEELCGRFGECPE